MPEDLIRIRHMLDAIHEVLAFTANKTRTDLDMVWDTIQEDLVPLIDELQRIIT